LFVCFYSIFAASPLFKLCILLKTASYIYSNLMHRGVDLGHIFFIFQFTAGCWILSSIEGLSLDLQTISHSNYHAGTSWEISGASGYLTWCDVKWGSEEIISKTHHQAFQFPASYTGKRFMNYGGAQNKPTNLYFTPSEAVFAPQNAQIHSQMP
jgi:hypothetical protein